MYLLVPSKIPTQRKIRFALHAPVTNIAGVLCYPPSLLRPVSRLLV